MAWIPEEIEKYCIQHSTAPGVVAKELEAYTREHIDGSRMLIGEMESAVLKFLLKINQTRTVVEFGTFTGYSALIMAEALPEDGRVITIDVNKETTDLARTYWDRAGVGNKIQQILKPGMEALLDLNEKYDFIFIDADKRNYPNYLQWATEHLTERGIIVTDNTLWSGKVIHPAQDTQTPFIQEHNTLAKSLEDFTKVLLPIRDGMYLLYRGL